MAYLDFILERPYEGSTYVCSNCGAEYVIPEDRDLPDQCEECGCYFDS